MNHEFLQRLLNQDPNSKVVCQIGNTLNIDYLNLQTSMMAEVFSNFPEVLLMIRCHNDKRKAMYTFLADGPRIGAKYNLTRIVHVAVPTNETPEGLRAMFHLMKELNPRWPSIQVFLVDPDFTEVNAIHKAFPSAEVVLSASYVCTHIQQRIHELLTDKAESILLDALKTTMCSATPRNLKNLHKMLEQMMTPDMLPQMKPDWLLADRIWALHSWRSWNDCSQYFEMVETVRQGFTAVFNISPCLLKSMNDFVSYIFGQTIGKSMPEHRNCSPEELALINCKVMSSETIKTEPQMEQETGALLRESLNNICIPAALGLCQNELEVSQKAIELVGNDEDKVSVQILENPCDVSGGDRMRCTCSFYRSTELPCRHILAALNASEEILQPDMLHKLWQKQAYGPTIALPISSDTLQILNAEGNDVSENHVLVSSLTSQISAALAECSDDIFQRRYDTLRQLADAWIGPYEEVKL